MKKPLVIHPVLFAIFPFLFFYAHNIQDIQQFRAIWILLIAGVSVGLAFLLWLLFDLFLKDRIKAGLATSILVFLLFTYGHFYSLVGKWDSLVPGHSYVIPGVLLAFGYCVYLIRRARRDFGPVTNALNVVAVVLIAINVFTVVSYEISLERTASSWTDATEQVVPEEVDNTPDIYFIILDGYAHPDIVKEHYGYDDEQFIKSLEERGFFVARDSTTHTEKSERAIASILNMEPIPETEPLKVTWQRITHNEVVDYLQAIGYRYIYFGQWYELGRYEIEADMYFNYYEDDEYEPFTAELSSVLLKTTILSPLHDYIAGERYEDYYRESLLRTLDHLGETPAIEGPKFVFAHVLAPHEPFVFGPDGEHVEPENFYNFDDKQFYLGQYIYITQEINRVINDLLNKSATEPIIIIQSDHGPRWIEGWEKILNAYYLPYDGKELLYDSISPIETFRVILNHYFDAGFEPSEDKR